MITKGSSTKLDMQEVFGGDVNLNMLYKPNTKTPSTQMELRVVRIRSRTKARTVTQEESNQVINSVDHHMVQLGTVSYSEVVGRNILIPFVLCSLSTLALWVVRVYTCNSNGLGTALCPI